jgi:hypothetical protein
MWVFTVDGMFSAVKNEFCSGDAVSVRGRCLPDLGRLKTVAGLGQEVPILHLENADYPFCIQIPATTWGRYLTIAAERMNYTNFKDAACSVDEKRGNALMLSWEACYRWW